MAYISASSMNSQAKCELAYHLSRSEEGKKVRAESGRKWAMTNGTILHHACQTYDVDKFLNKSNPPTTDAEVRRRYEESYQWFFSDAENLKREKIEPDQAKLGLELISACKRWLWEEDVKKAAELSHVIGTLQNKLKWQFSVRKPMTWYYKESYDVLRRYMQQNPLDVYGEPLEFCIEKAYNIQYGDQDACTGYADERRVYMVNGRRSVFLIEMKTSATSYTPEDCSIDTQMGLYVFYENIDSGTAYEDIYVVMAFLQDGVYTITQRTEENIDFLMRHTDERLRRQNEVASGIAMPMPRCGTNSYDHSNLLCDYKDICPVWQQINSQPKPIVLGTKPEKVKKK